MSGRSRQASADERPRSKRLGALATETAGKSKVLGLTVTNIQSVGGRDGDNDEVENLHGDTLGVDGGQVGVLEEGDEVLEAS
jgi:hypothetical protein